MNTERLLSLVRILLEDEQQFSLQNSLQNLVNAFNNLVSSPQTPEHQVQVSNEMESFANALGALEGDSTPAFVNRMREIGAEEFFSSSMLDRIRASLGQNAMTPAVVQQEVQKLFDRRSNFLRFLRGADENLAALGFTEDELKESEAEIGFQVPRAIFHNELGQLSKELHNLRQIIRAFSELAGNAGEPIEVRQISTTDPIFFLAVGICTIKMIGSAVTWGLETWRKVEEIKKLRAETANLKGIPAAESIVAQYDKLIKEHVEARIKEEAARLVPMEEGQVGRQRELLTHVEQALTGLLARIERGMTVEIRLLPPPTTEGNEGEGDGGDQRVFDELQIIQKQLIFPPASPVPHLKLTTDGDGSGAVP